ncbi:MAG: hypothetical protein JNL67_06820 [Planctomycetaceae bacterium]|nr:hypothetical protein [Planctomycetaceae bacterium]
MIYRILRAEICCFRLRPPQQMVWPCRWLLLATCAAFLTNSAIAQNRNSFHSSGMAPGVVGQQQAYRVPDAQGYLQPVEVQSTTGAQVSIQTPNGFSPGQNRVNAALLVGGVYAYRITNIPEQPGAELYPTIEVVHRLYPPAGLAARFPIVVDLNADDIQSALDGNFVVKVIYLEDPDASRMQIHDGIRQPTFELKPGADLLSEADLMGRPMAIVRIGSRLPEAAELISGGFGPPLTILSPTTEQASPATVKWNQEAADKDPSYVPQMLAPQDGHAGMWNSEHIFDGGDRHIQALVGTGSNWEVNGLDPEDTIGHFDTLDGQRLVVSSNRVAIYAPRFAAVRQILNVAQTIREMPALSTESVLPHEVQGSKALASSTAQFDQLRQMRDTKSAQGVRQRTTPTWNVGQIATNETSGTNATADLVSLVQQAELSNTQKAMLAKGRQAAIAWTGVESVQAIADFQSVQVVLNVDKADEVVESHSPNNRPKLNVVKLASQDAAQQGDVIDFVLRFENVGDQTIGNVTIMDHLSDRLEFVAGSASCDLACEFYTQTNDQGTTILRWDIEKPLKVTAGGVIRFSCRVR